MLFLTKRTKRKINNYEEAERLFIVIQRSKSSSLGQPNGISVKCDLFFDPYYLGWVYCVSYASTTTVAVRIELASLEPTTFSFNLNNLKQTQ